MDPEKKIAHRVLIRLVLLLGHVGQKFREIY